MLVQVIAELQLAWPHVIEITYAETVVTFATAIGSDIYSLIYLPTRCRMGLGMSPSEFILDTPMANLSCPLAMPEPIPIAATSRLFQPFVRDAVTEDQQGLGLGLYFAAESLALTVGF